MRSFAKLKTSVILFVRVIRFIAIRKYAFFCIYWVRLSPDTHSPNLLDLS